MELMAIWDQLVSAHSPHDLPLFLTETRDNFLLFEQVFYYCDSHIRIYGELLRTSIQNIFYEVLKSRVEIAILNILLVEVFSQECKSATHEK